MQKHSVPGGEGARRSPHQALLRHRHPFHSSQTPLSKSTCWTGELHWFGVFLEAGSGVESISLVHIIHKALLRGEILSVVIPPGLGRAGLSAQ